MHLATIIVTFRLLIVDVAMGQIPRSTERISSLFCDLLTKHVRLSADRRGLVHLQQPELRGQRVQNHKFGLDRQVFFCKLLHLYQTTG